MEAAMAAAMEEAVLVRSRCSRLSSVAGAMAARVAAVIACRQKTSFHAV